MKVGDWLFEIYGSFNNKINVLMEVLYIDNNRVEVMWYDTKYHWKSKATILHTDDIENFLFTNKITIISKAKAAKYLLAELK